MRVAIQHHLAGGLPFARALEAAGHELVTHAPDVFMLDLDLSHNHALIDAHVVTGAKVFTYPHGIGLFHYWDGIEDPYPAVSGTFVPTEGYVDVYRKMGVTRPLYVVGWLYCEQREFRPNPAPKRVLFAPEHPLDDGYLSDWQQELNRTAYRALLTVPGIELKVRYLMELHQNGLWEEPGVEFKRGLPDNSYDDIDAADVVVASGTFAHLSVARGAPTIWFGQNIHPSNAEHPGEPTYAKSWENWRWDARYPFDIADGPAAELVRACAASEEPIADWKRRWIGRPMTEHGFAAVFEQAVADTIEPLEARSFVVVADANEIVASPGLLAAYVKAFSPADDATLVLLTAGGDQSALVERLGYAFSDLGLDEDQLPDMLLAADPGAGPEHAAIARQASAVLSDAPAAGAYAVLPRRGAADAHELAQLASEPLAA